MIGSEIEVSEFLHFLRHLTQSVTVRLSHFTFLPNPEPSVNWCLVFGLMLLLCSFFAPPARKLSAQAALSRLQGTQHAKLHSASLFHD